jgi:maltose phosphorylase
MLATRGGYDQTTGKYGYYGVMGPDEFQLMVNHNMYTNYMAKKTFEFTVETVKKLNASELAQLNLKKGEVEDWQEKADKMYVSSDEKTLLYEQHAGYFSLPHVDVNSIPVEDFPLYANWSYDRIYRNDMIKQPDVLMFMCLYPSDFSSAQIAANYDYYEPRCIHESSLSPSVHSILASRLGRDDKAYEFFKFASRMDLDNYNRNTREGLHMPSIAGSWMNIVYGFAGLRSDGDILSLSPRLPETWENLSFKLLHRGVGIEVFISRNEIYLRTSGDKKLAVKVYGNEIIPDDKGVRVPYGCLEGSKRRL